MSAAAGTATARKVLLSLVGGGLVLGVGALLMVALLSDARPAAAGLVGRPAPVLAGETLDGGTADLADLRGSVVLVNVWASWCGPCREELPLLVSTQSRYGDQGLEVLGLNMRDGPVAARALLAETGAESLTSVVDPDGGTAVGWGVRGVPETFLVDRDGVLRARFFGAVTEEWVQEEVVPWLQERPSTET